MQSPEKSLENHERNAKDTMQSTIFIKLSVLSGIRRTTEGKMPSTLPSMVIQVLYVAQNDGKCLKNNGGNNGTILPDLTVNVSKHYLLHGPWRFVPSPVTI